MGANNKQDTKLSQNFKTLLMRNLGELSKVQGNILSAAENREIKTIFITSCNSFEGKTVTALSMAYALSTEARAKVLLVDANLYSPKIYELFNLDSAPGLSDLILSNAKYSEAIKKTEYDNLFLMPHGTEISNPLQVFTSQLFENRLGFLKQNFDYTIFDGPSVLGFSDVSVIARYFDGVIFVIECEKTRWEVLREAKENIEKVGGNILGVVLNKRKYYIPRVLYGKI